MKKKIAIFGSTGSIGTQALEVIRAHPEGFAVSVLTANRQADLLIQQAREFLPSHVVIADESRYSEVRGALQDLPISVHAGKTIALANKETMVVAGAIVTEKARAKGVNILPVDSEHSAIYQCLLGERNPLEQILLTASGGPFLHVPTQQLDKVTPKDALKHPNWSMGAKVTIDSASLMNKGFEMMEACWFFDVPPSKIEVLIHPQSIIHSMVQFEDGSVKAQLGQPDMRLPISFALGEELRLNNKFPRLDFTKLQLTFQHPDLERFPNLSLAYHAMEAGKASPCALNAANEVAVDAFLHEQIGFTTIHEINAYVLGHLPSIADANVSLEALIETNEECRQMALQLVRQYAGRNFSYAKVRL